MKIPETYDLNVCTDCIVLIANATVPVDWAEEAVEDWLAEIERNWPGGEWVLAPGDGDTEFTRTPCDTCRTGLAGSRHGAHAFHPTVR